MVLDPVVPVGKHISLGDDHAPGNLRVYLSELRRHMAGSLADNLQAAFDAQAESLVGLIVGEAYSLRNVPHGLGPPEHVPEIGRVALVRPHRRDVSSGESPVDETGCPAP